MKKQLLFLLTIFFMGNISQAGPVDHFKKSATALGMLTSEAAVCAAYALTNLFPLTTMPIIGYIANKKLTPAISSKALRIGSLGAALLAYVVAVDQFLYAAEDKGHGINLVGAAAFGLLSGALANNFFKGEPEIEEEEKLEEIDFSNPAQ